VDFDNVFAHELYLHETDPEEFSNVVDDAPNTDLVQQLSNKLRLGWRQVLTDYLASVQA
jgi:hypothetical protein